MTPTKTGLTIILYTGCYYVGIGCGCDGCPFEEARERNKFRSCRNLLDNPHLLLKIASEAYRTDKKFAEIFDERCAKYKDALSLKAVIL